MGTGCREPAVDAVTKLIGPGLDLKDRGIAARPGRRECAASGRPPVKKAPVG